MQSGGSPSDDTMYTENPEALKQMVLPLTEKSLISVTEPSPPICHRPIDLSAVLASPIALFVMDTVMGLSVSG